MTAISRRTRSRRGGRKPGWALLTALLLLAFGANVAALFANRTNLLKLAVMVALWAVVVAAFVSVFYRRKSDIDAAKARDLKLVYDLQLDREIAARREYELEVETQLRRELTDELHARASDEVAALRAELAALRTNLEILFDTDFAQRPAIETERTTVRAFSDWDREDDRTDPGRISRPRFAASAREDVEREDRIIDVPEEPPEPEHRAPWRPYSAEPRSQPQSQPQSRWASGQYPPPPAEPAPRPVFRPEPEPQHERHAADDWQPSPWLSSGNGFAPPDTGERAAEPAPVAAEPRAGRHSSGVEPGGSQTATPAPEAPERNITPTLAEVFPTPPPPAPASPPPRHRTAESPPDLDRESQGQHGEGQGTSVADLLARLQQNGPREGGGRRRRDD